MWCTRVYQIDVQDKINVQVKKFFKNIKRAGLNRRVGGKFSGKSINVQGKNFWKINNRAGGNKRAGGIFCL